MIASGRVTGLWRWPVKSLAGERLRATRLGPGGLAGDRVHAVADAGGRSAGRTLTARQAPRMLAWSASYPDHPDDALGCDGILPATVRSPTGQAWRWGSRALEQALSDSLARPVVLLRPLGGHHDEPRTVHITVEASVRALQQAVGRPVDVRRFRPNVHLQLDVEPFAEARWDDARLRLGGTMLTLLGPCPRCVMPSVASDGSERWRELHRVVARDLRNVFGILARADTAGSVAVGDAVRVEAS